MWLDDRKSRGGLEEEEEGAPAKVRRYAYGPKESVEGGGETTHDLPLCDVCQTRGEGMSPATAASILSGPGRWREREPWMVRQTRRGTISSVPPPTRA